MPRTRISHHSLEIARPNTTRGDAVCGEDVSWLMVLNSVVMMEPAIDVAELTLPAHDGRRQLGEHLLVATHVWHAETIYGSTHSN